MIIIHEPLIGLCFFLPSFSGVSELKRVSKVLTKPGYLSGPQIYRSDGPGRSWF